MSFSLSVSVLAATIALSGAVLGAAAANAEDVAPPPVAAGGAARHPTPWPIRHWRNHQPRRNDISPEQARQIDQLYMQIEKENPELIAPAFRGQ